MKRYLVSLLITSLVLIIVALSLAMFNPTYFRPILPCTVLYFAVVTLLEHLFIVTSAKKSPRVFIKNLLGGTVAVLFIHLIVMAVWMFTHRDEIKIFIVGFCICYMVFLAFESLALIFFIRRRRKEAEGQDQVASIQEN